MDYGEFWAAEVARLQEEAGPAIEANRAELRTRALTFVIGERRVEMGLTTEQAAARAGVSTEKWEVWEELGDDGLDHLDQIATAVGMPRFELDLDIETQWPPSDDGFRFAALQVVIAAAKLQPMIYGAILDDEPLDPAAFSQAVDLVIDAALVLGELPEHDWYTDLEERIARTRSDIASMREEMDSIIEGSGGQGRRGPDLRIVPPAED